MATTKFKEKGSLSPLYIISLTLVFLAITAIVTNTALQRIESETRSNIRNSLQAILQATVTSYHTWVEYRINDIEEIASDSYVKKQAKLLLGNRDNNLHLNNLRNYIQPKLRKRNDQGFFIIDRKNISLASMRDNNLNSINLIYQQRPEYLAKAFKGESLFVPTLHSDVPLNQDKNKTTVNPNKELSGFVISPIYKDKTIIAVLAIRIDLNAFFTQATDYSQLGRTGETYAFDRNGIMITNSRFDQQLRRTGIVAPNDNSIMNVRISDPGGDLSKNFKPSLERDQQPLTAMAKSATKGETNYNIKGYRDYRGIEVFGAWLWDSALGFGVATEIDVKEAMLPFHQTRNTIIGVLAITLIMSLSLLATVIKIQSNNKRKLKKAYNSLERRVKERTQELTDAKKALEKANCDLEILATTDGLTGLANRRTFDLHIENEWLRCRREKMPLGIMILDIDYFKNYNDHYGHQMGDHCLQNISKLLINDQFIRRPGDLIARYGGEEFILVLSNPTHEFIKSTAERLVNSIRQKAIPHEKTKLKEKVVTTSLGFIIESDLNSSTPAELIRLADQALYEAKFKGRNRACQSSTEKPSQVIKGSFGENTKA